MEKGIGRRLLCFGMAVFVFLGGVCCFGAEQGATSRTLYNSSYAGDKYGGFSDIGAGHWAYVNVSKLAGAGVLEGYPDGSFRPAQAVTYGEFIKMVSAALDLELEHEEDSAAKVQQTQAEEMQDVRAVLCKTQDAEAVWPETQQAQVHWAEKYYDAMLEEGFLHRNVIEKGMMNMEIPRKHMAHIAACVVRGEFGRKTEPGNTEYEDSESSEAVKVSTEYRGNEQSNTANVNAEHLHSVISNVASGNVASGNEVSGNEVRGNAAYGQGQYEEALQRTLTYSDAESFLSDVSAAGENGDEIVTAIAAGILTGYPDGTFRGNETLTRAEAAAVAWRIFQKAHMGQDVAGGQQEAQENGEDTVSGQAGIAEKDKGKDEGKNDDSYGENAGGQNGIGTGGSESEDVSNGGKQTEGTSTDSNGGDTGISSGSDAGIGGKATGETVVRSVQKGGNTVAVEYEVFETTAAESGIAKAVQTSARTIKIYSKNKYPFIKIMLENGELLKGVGFPGGSCYEENGQFVYVADPEGRDLSKEIADGNLYFVVDDEAKRVYRVLDM